MCQAISSDWHEKRCMWKVQRKKKLMPGEKKSISPKEYPSTLVITNRHSCNFNSKYTHIAVSLELVKDVPLQHEWKKKKKKEKLPKIGHRSIDTSAFWVQLYIHMVQWGQLIPLRVRDSYGGHRRDDLLFFVRLLCGVRVHAWDLSAGRAEWERFRVK